MGDQQLDLDLANEVDGLAQQLPNSFSQRSFNKTSQEIILIPPYTNLLRTMISRSAIGRNAQLALRRQCCGQPANRRGLAATVSGSTSFSYETADVGGVKVASRDVSGPTTKLAVVAKAGTRYQNLPGLTTGLEQFAFKVRRHQWNAFMHCERSNDPSSIRTPKRDLPYGSRENPSFLEVNWSHTTREKPWWLRPNS